MFIQVAGVVGSGSLHALEVDTEGAVEEYKEVRTDGVCLFDLSSKGSCPRYQGL